MEMDDLERRVGTLEMEFKEYMAIFYKWLDETRQEMKEFRRNHEERMRKLEEQDAKIVDTQGMLIRVLRAMDDKLDNHEDRLNSSVFKFPTYTSPATILLIVPK